MLLAVRVRAGRPQPRRTPTLRPLPPRAVRLHEFGRDAGGRGPPPLLGGPRPGAVLAVHGPPGWPRRRSRALLELPL